MHLQCHVSISRPVGAAVSFAALYSTLIEFHSMGSFGLQTMFEAQQTGADKFVANHQMKHKNKTIRLFTGSYYIHNVGVLLLLRGWILRIYKAV